MKQCEICNGFVPASLPTCPHCQKVGQPVKRMGRRVMQLLMGAGFTMTLSACYGAPPPLPVVPCDPAAGDSEEPCPGPSPTLTPEPSSSASVLPE